MSGREALKKREPREPTHGNARSRRLALDDMLPKLRGLFDKHQEVEAAILFGSTVTRGAGARDIDVALKLAKEDLLDVGYIVSQISQTLGVSEERVDVTILDQGNPMLLSKILKDGIVIKGGHETIQQLLQKAQEAPDALMEFKQWSSLDPKLDKTIIISRVEEIRRNAAFIKDEILSKRVEDLDYKDTLALERAMHRIIESMLDVCRHLVSVHSLGLAESYGEYPERLARAGMMPKELSKDVAKLAGLRDTLMRRYLEIKTDLLYRAAEETIEIVSRFTDWAKTIDH